MFKLQKNRVTNCDSHIPLSRERAREGKLCNPTPPEEGNGKLLKVTRLCGYGITQLRMSEAVLVWDGTVEECL